MPTLISALVAVRRDKSTSGCSVAKRFKMADSRPPAPASLDDLIDPKYNLEKTEQVWDDSSKQP